MPKGSIEWEYHPEEGLVLHIRPAPHELFPEKVLAHVKTSRKEMLLAIRDLLDIVIQKTEEKEKASRKSRTKIKVE